MMYDVIAKTNPEFEGWPFILLSLSILSDQENMHLCQRKQRAVCRCLHHFLCNIFIGRYISSGGH